ncbi:MAG: AAA family ATPase [Candidatus Omnitrophota bacterium]
MYEKYWNLKEKPFQNTPDPRYLYLSAQHEDALMKLSYVVAQGLGCGMLTGVFGCGKTLLGRVILNDLGKDRYRCAFITNPCVSEPAELLRAIVRGLSPQPLPEKKTELLADPLLEKLNSIFLDNIREGKGNIVVIDEAHTIEDVKLFEEMRLILNFQLEDKFLLTLLILGQPELKDKIENLKPLDQRVAVRCHLVALNEEEVGKYIQHRLKVAGREDSADNSIFNHEVIKIIFQHTGGIPRRINTLCDLVLMSAFAKKVIKIESDLIKSVIKDFNLS